jgi:hypothetical protein
MGMPFSVCRSGCLWVELKSSGRDTNVDSQTKARITAALRAWVDIRRAQATASTAGGRAQTGRRASVTGGKHLGPLSQLVVDEIQSLGVANLELRHNRAATLAGYYRPSKSWDLLVTQEKQPLLAIEYKSMSGSEGKNLNNRADEVFGIAEDARAAEEHGILPPGLLRAYIFVMGANDDSTRPIGMGPVVGKPDPVFDAATYLDRMAIMLERMRSTGLYHLVWAVGVVEEPFSWFEPRESIGWDAFVSGLRKGLEATNLR